MSNPKIDYKKVAELLDNRSKTFIVSGASEGERNAELYHTCQQLCWNHVPQDIAIGWMLNSGEMCGLKSSEVMATLKSAYRTKGTPIPRVSSYLASCGTYISTIEDRDEYRLPPASGTLREWADLCFSPGEQIMVAMADSPHAHKCFNVTNLVDLIESGKSPMVSFSGLYCTFNPMLGDRRLDSAVNDFRHAIIEFDTIKIEDQWRKVVESGIPISAAVFSGSKSIHFWVKVGAPSLEEYKERCKVLSSMFPDCDKKLLHPGAWTRMPGAMRQSTTQEIIKLNFGAKSWDEYFNSSEDEDEDKVINVWEWLENVELEPDEVIQDILHRGCKMILGGSSKSRKSWTLLDMAISVASGTEWMGFQTHKSRVVFVNMEIHKSFLQKRIRDIVTAKGLSPSDVKDTLFCIHRRGRPLDSVELAKLIHKKVTRLRDISIVIIDPIYKTLNGLDENKAGDISVLMNTFDSMAYIDDISVVFAAHFAKGGGQERDSIDRVSGSGVFARDPDSFMTVTRYANVNTNTPRPRRRRGRKGKKDERAPEVIQQEEAMRRDEQKLVDNDNVFLVETHLRHHIPIEPVKVIWEYPLFSRIVDQEIDLGDFIPVVGDEDEMDIKYGKAVTYTQIWDSNLSNDDLALLEKLPDDGASLTDWKLSSGLSEGSFKGRKSKLELAGRIFLDSKDNTWKRTISVKP